MQVPHLKARRVPLLVLVPVLALVLAAVPAQAGTGAASAPAKPAPHKAAAKHHHPRPGPPLTTVSIERAFPGEPVPSGFIGLSFEVGNLAQLAGYADNGDLVTLLRSLGPGVLRFGGVTADKNVAWVDARTPRPAWASAVIDEGDLRALGQLAARSGWRVLLTLNLGHFEPEAAAREAAAAKAALGPWLEGLELGNEPNAYGRQGLREEPWTFLQYDSQVATYRSAIEALAPGVPIVGPDVSGSSAFETWGLGMVVNQPPVLLTGHHYPLSCQGPPTPTIERLLSPQIRALEVVSLQRYLSIAQAGEIPFRLDEANSVSCGGVPGISNTFAGALWAAAYVSEAMSIGIDGINLHGNPDNCLGYAPLCAPTQQAIETGALVPQPEWYALLDAEGADRRPSAHDHPRDAPRAQPPGHHLPRSQRVAAGRGRRRRSSRHLQGLPAPGGRQGLPLRAAAPAHGARPELVVGGSPRRHGGGGRRHLDGTRDAPGGARQGRRDHARGRAEPRDAAVDRTVDRVARGPGEACDPAVRSSKRTPAPSKVGVRVVEGG